MIFQLFTLFIFSLISQVYMLFPMFNPLCCPTHERPATVAPVCRPCPTKALTPVTLPTIVTTPIIKTTKLPHPIKPICYEPKCPEAVPVIITLPNNNITKEVNTAIRKGKKLAKILTFIGSSPFIYYNSKLSAKAGALPGLLAAKGALIGSAIATPVQIVAAAKSGLASALVGSIVSIPVAIGTQITSGAIILKHYLKGLPCNSPTMNSMTTRPVKLINGICNINPGTLLFVGNYDIQNLGSFANKAGGLMNVSNVNASELNTPPANLKFINISGWFQPQQEQLEKVMLCVETEDKKTVTDTFYKLIPVTTGSTLQEGIRLKSTSNVMLLTTI